MWRSIFYSAVIGWILLLAITFAGDRATEGGRRRRRLRPVAVLNEALSTGWFKFVLLISTVGQLFCGTACLTSASRMCYAFSRDGAIPGWRIWSRVNQRRVPFNAVLFMAVCAAIITVPAYFPQQRRHPGRVPRRRLDRGHRALHRLRDPDLPALAHGRRVRGRALDQRPQVQLDEPDRGRLGGVSSRHLHPADDARRRAVATTSSTGTLVNYAPLVTGGLFLAVGIWWLVSAKHTFTGPRHTISRARRRARRGHSAGAAGSAVAP